MTKNSKPRDDSLQEQVEDQEKLEVKGYGAFSGVFVPVTVTLLGLILFLRQGWIVGQAGLLGSWTIITLTYAIITCTALSMSIIISNLRTGACSAYSIIAQSLGLEVGGSVGLPLYLSQALSVTIFIIGFREGWLYIFPEHPGILVDFGTLVLMLVITLISLKLAFRLQYLILGLILVSIGSFVLNYPNLEAQPIVWWGEYSGAIFEGIDILGSELNFWLLFAIFFPVGTGIVAGANLSGELREPQKSVPAGTIGGIGVTYLIYMALAFLFIRMIPLEELQQNFLAMADYSLVSEIVLVGLLGATFSSGLALMMGAPRVLESLDEHEILPTRGNFIRKTEDSQPRNAILLTALIVALTLLLRDLNLIAPLITMFFLITFTLINFVVVLEKKLDMISFRPTLELPVWIPLVGLFGCLTSVFIISPTFGLIAFATVIILYYHLSRKTLEAPEYGDIRSGLMFSLAEWSAKQVESIPSTNERAWKPNLLVPVRDCRELHGTFDFLINLTRPRGSIHLLGLRGEDSHENIHQELSELADDFRQEKIFTRCTIMHSDEFEEGVSNAIQALSGAFFRPNILFLTTPPEKYEDSHRKVILRARRLGLGVQLLAEDPLAKLGRRRSINVWLKDQSPDWELSFELGNIDLQLLTAYKLRRNWGGKMQVIMAVCDEKEQQKARHYVDNLLDLARLKNVDVKIECSDFKKLLASAPRADVDLFGLPPSPDFKTFRRWVDLTRSACIFVADSGEENIIA